MSRKSEVYSWRVAPAVKAALEEAARREGRTVSQLLDQIVAEKLEALKPEPEEAERQRQLQERAKGFAGCLTGGDPRRAGNASVLVRTRLKRRSPSAS